MIFLQCLQDHLFAAPASHIYLTPMKDRILSNESKSPVAVLKARALNIPGYSAPIANNPEMAHIEQLFHYAELFYLRTFGLLLMKGQILPVSYKIILIHRVIQAEYVLVYLLQ